MGVKVLDQATPRQPLALTSLERVKYHLGIPAKTGDHDPELIALINEASSWARSYTGQPLRQTSYQFRSGYEEPLTGDGTNELYLPFAPVIFIDRLVPDRRNSDNWTWDGATEGGSMTYGWDEDWVFDQMSGKITMTNGLVFPRAKVVEVSFAAGFADEWTGTDDAPFGDEWHAPTLETHPLLGWKTAGAEIEHAATRLVGHFWRSKDRERDGIQSRSGEGTTVTFFGDIPKEIREIFDRHKRRPM